MLMTTPAITFDRLAYVDRLKEAGVDDKQARAHADALDAALRDGVATRGDIDDLRRELRATETKLETKIETAVANLKVDVLRWLVLTQVALAGVIIAVVKFMR